MYIDNIFTKIINNEIHCERIFEDEFTLVIKDIHPKANTHLLVLPKNNYIDLKDFLNRGASNEITSYFNCIKMLLNKLSSSKVQFNIGSESGQEIFHLHAHILSDDLF